MSSREIVIAEQFRGPPNSGNGGYVGGLMAALIDGPATAVLRAPPPIDAPLVLKRDGRPRGHGDARGRADRRGLGGDQRAVRRPARPASHTEAIAAGARFVGLTRVFHPVCFCCGDKLAEGYGLRVFVGQIEGAAPGHVAGPWTPLAPFVDDLGLATPEVIWAALDCPGSVSWVVTEGGGGLLGTMTCEITRRPKLGEACIVTAWPIEQSGRKRLSGTALFTADGELLAQSRQIWIGRAPVPPVQA